MGIPVQKGRAGWEGDKGQGQQSVPGGASLRIFKLLSFAVD